MIVFAFRHRRETFHGIGQIDEDSREAGEHFGDMEGLRQEALDLAAKTIASFADKLNGGHADKAENPASQKKQRPHPDRRATR